MEKHFDIQSIEGICDYWILFLEFVFVIAPFSWYDMYMKKIIQVHISKGDAYFVAECIDLPVVTQGRILDELAENLKEAIALQLEG